MAGLAGHTGSGIQQVLEASTLEKVRKTQGAPDPTPDFQVEAEEDIKSETSGTVQDLLLALAKVRRTDLQGKGDKPPGNGVGQSGEHCCGERALGGDQVWFVVLEIKSCPSENPPETVSF